VATARAIFQAHVDGLYPESIPLDLQWTLLAAVGQLTTITLAAGDNTLAIPAGTTLIGIKPPTTNGIVLKLKGAGGDTGFTLQPSIPFLLSWAAGTVLINAVSQVPGVQLAFL
jgi:hypothetical protein